MFDEINAISSQLGLGFGLSLAKREKIIYMASQNSSMTGLSITQLLYDMKMENLIILFFILNLSPKSRVDEVQYQTGAESDLSHEKVEEDCVVPWSDSLTTSIHNIW